MPADPSHGLRRFLTEIRRRRVLRVAVVYAVVGWGVLQAATLLVPELLLPDWITRAIVVLVLLGFPIALVLAWAFEITPEGVRRTEPAPTTPAAAGPAAEPAGGDAATVPAGDAAGGPGAAAGLSGDAAWWRVRPGVLAMVVLVVAMGVAGAAYGLHRSAVRRARAMLPRIERLAAARHYTAAYRLAVRASRVLPHDTTLRRLWPKISNRLTVITDPPGAQVLERLLPDDSGRAAAATRSSAAVAARASSSGFTALGTTPLDSVRIPRTPALLRIEEKGYATAERLASNELSRAQNENLGLFKQIRLRVPLIPVGEAPGMVFVPGGEYQLVTPDLPPGLKARLDGYFIDRYEVSNAKFRQFVTAGGYADPSLWPTPVLIDGDTVPLDSALKRFVDRTGLSGPRGWTSQEPPPGKGDYPVTGVSWYEASAYCAFRGKRLPTVFQWEKAARNGRVTHAEGVVMPWGYASPEGHYRNRADFSGVGTVPVDAHPFGISPFGAYAMAGNVKEWTANAIGTGRAVTGGSWSDPMYVFAEFGTFDPGYASGSLGFRCARVRAHDARAERGQGDYALDVSHRTPTYVPVDSETFRTLLSSYRYDPVPLKPRVLDSVSTPDWVRLRLSYGGPGGERVLAYLWLPKSAPPPYQPLLFVPGADVFFGINVAESTEHWLAPLVRSGRAIFAVVMKGMTEREWGPGYTPPAPPTVRFRNNMILHATEMRLGLDYLQSRGDMDMSRLAYVGLSWGAGSRLGFAAVDPRFRAVVFIGGGIDERLKPTLPAADNVNFAPYIRVPKLMVNGRHDEENDWFTRGLPLWNLLRPPKKLVLAQNAGHIPPAEVRIPAINTFLDSLFGSPTVEHRRGAAPGGS